MAEPKETPAQATRRRWISFGEVVAVAAVLISAASWWDGRQARERDEAARAAEGQPKAGPSLIITATPISDGDGLQLAAARGDQVIQSQTLIGPGGASADSTGPGTLDAALVEVAARQRTNRSGRIPVAILTRYVEGDAMREDRALYDVGYRRHERVLRSDAVELTGLSLVRRLGKSDPQAAVDARYGKRS